MTWYWRALRFRYKCLLEWRLFSGSYLLSLDGAIYRVKNDLNFHLFVRLRHDTCKPRSRSFNFMIIMIIFYIVSIILTHISLIFWTVIFIFIIAIFLRLIFESYLKIKKVLLFWVNLFQLHSKDWELFDAYFCGVHINLDLAMGYS